MADLFLFNPWWESPESIHIDRYISAYQQSMIKWRPGILNEFDFNRDAVYTLLGPRQVGKTTLIRINMKAQKKEGPGE